MGEAPTENRPTRRATIAAIHAVERTSESPRLLPWSRFRELVSYREILLNLIRKELKVKYTASVLGAVWSLLNPVVYLAVFSFVVRMLDARVPDFPVFLLSGLLVWNFFANALQAGARAVIDNANLVKKIAFPREILPLSSVGVALFDLALQSAVLLLFIAISGHGFRLGELWLYPVALATLLVFTTAATLWVSALNVRYRDVGHLIGIGLLVWFWLTPIVYQGALVETELLGVPVLGVDAWTLYLLNPLTIVVLAVQRALYGATAGVLPDVSIGWHAATLAVMLAASIVFLLLAWRSFFHRSGDFAEEL